jgi:hypothetical protein
MDLGNLKKYSKQELRGQVLGFPEHWSTLVKEQILNELIRREVAEAEDKSFAKIFDFDFD